MCKYNHLTCNKIKEEGGNSNGNAGICPLMKYNKYAISKRTSQKIIIDTVMICILGKEISGRYVNQYNISAGRGESDCYIETAIREFNEEFHIYLDLNLFYKYCVKNGYLRYILHKTTPVFIIELPYELKRIELNNNIDKYQNINIPFQYREIVNLDFFTLDGKKLDNKINKYPVEISSFATAILSKINIDML